MITITPSGGFAATVAAPYTQTFTFNGGAQPWSGFQVTNLPTGLSITGTTANTVTISGTPTQAGSFNLNVSATDSSTGNGPYAVGQAFTLTVAAPTLTMTPAAGHVECALRRTPFSQTFTASGGIGPYTYAVTGALPAGMSFSGDMLSGTPTVPGSYPITVTATDTGSTGTGSPFTVAQNYTIDVPAPTIVVNPATLPNPTAGYGLQPDGHCDRRRRRLMPSRSLRAACLPASRSVVAARSRALRIKSARSTSPITATDSYRPDRQSRLHRDASRRRADA